LFGAERISESAVSPLADNVVLLGYQLERDTIGRTIAVIKTRASRHDPMVRKFVIGSQGIVLDELLPAAEDSRQSDGGLASVPSPYRAPAALHRPSHSGRLWAGAAPSVQRSRSMHRSRFPAPVVSVGVTTPQHRADLFLDPASDPREGGPRLGDERTTLN